MKVPVKLGRGINRDAPPWELELGFHSDCQNMRFRNGQDERVGGLAAVFTTPAVVPYFLDTYQIGGSNMISRYILQAGLAKCYADDNSTQTEITRQIELRISAATRASNVITFTTPSAHGFSTSDSVITSGLGTVSFNGTFTIASTPTSTTFTVANVGADESVTAGTNAVVRKATTDDFGGDADTKWTGGNLNSVYIFNNPRDGLYYFNSISNRMRRIINSATSISAANYPYADAARPYRDFLFLLGARFSSDARNSTTLNKKPYSLYWASSTEPGVAPSQFTAAATNDAGNVDKTRGALVDALTLGETFYVYQEYSILAVDYIGGNDVFSFRYLEGTDGLLAANCVVNTPKGQVFFSQNFDVKIHAGGSARSIAEGRILNWIRANIDSTYYKRSFLCVNKKFSEVWVCIPTSGNSTCNKALLWNWESDTWGERDLSGVTFGASGMLPTTIATDERLVISTTTPRLGLVDSGTTDFGSSYTSMVERLGIHLDKETQKKTLHTTRWSADCTAANTQSIYHGSHSTPDTTATYATDVTRTQNTTRDVNRFANSAEYMAVKMTTTADWKCRTLELEYNEDGEF